MSNFLNSPNMNLPVPVILTDPGPDYATNINLCLSRVDSHNHSAGQGVPITPSGLSINGDLPFGNNNATSLRSLRFFPQSAVLAQITDLGCLYEVGVDLYYNDGSGNQIRITQSGGISGTPGSIANLTSPASASYVSASSTFVWQSAANTPATMDGGSFIFRNIVASSNGVTMSAPGSLAGNYTLTLPAALPGSTSLMAVDASGNISATISSTAPVFTTSVTVGTSGPILTNSSGNLSLTGGVTVSAGSTIQFATKAALTSPNTKTLAVGNQYAAVSNTNPGTNGLAIVRGLCAVNSTIISGEGFTSTRTSAGRWTVGFNTAFVSQPAVIITPASLGNFTAVAASIAGGGTGFTCAINDSAGTPADVLWSFIAIGERA